MLFTEAQEFLKTEPWKNVSREYQFLAKFPRAGFKFFKYPDLPSDTMAYALYYIASYQKTYQSRFIISPRYDCEENRKQQFIQALDDMVREMYYDQRMERKGCDCKDNTKLKVFWRNLKTGFRRSQSGNFIEKIKDKLGIA